MSALEQLFEALPVDLGFGLIGLVRRLEGLSGLTSG